MTTQETIDQFLSDAVYRIGEIGAKLDSMADSSNHECYHLRLLREDLSMFCSILRHTTMSIIDGSNFLTEWTDYEILKECEYLRRKAGMNILPIANFLNHAVPVFIGSMSSSPSEGGGGSASFPIGSPGDTIFYNVAGELYADSISPYAGAGSDSINTYFAGRP